MGHQDWTVTTLKGKWTWPRDGCREVSLSHWGEDKCIWCYCYHLEAYIGKKNLCGHLTTKGVAHSGQDGLELSSHSTLFIVFLPLLQRWEQHRLLFQTSLKQNAGCNLGSHHVLVWFQVRFWVLLFLLGSVAKGPSSASSTGFTQVSVCSHWPRRWHLFCWCGFQEAPWLWSRQPQ